MDDTRPVTVRAASNDRAVRGTMSPAGEVTIELDPARVARLSAADLGAAVTEVLRGLVTGSRKAGAAVDGEPPPDPSRARTPVERALAGYYRELAALDVEVVSPRGVAKAAWRDERPSVRVRPDSPPPPAWVLTGEINAAVAAMFAEFTRRGRACFSEHVCLERFMEEP